MILLRVIQRKTTKRGLTTILFEICFIPQGVAVVPLRKGKIYSDFRHVGESQKGNSYQLNAAQNVAFPSFMY